MKKIRISFLSISLFMVCFIVHAQENRITLSGGYSFANIEDVDQNGQGWRVNALYEFNPNEGMVAHGLSFGYIGLNATTENLQTAEYKTNTLPLYYAPKLILGKNSFKAFLKGALGLHFSSYKREAAIETSTWDTGFYGGLAAGIVKGIGDHAFVNLEYEWAYLSNSFYRDGFMNSVMLGFGYKF